MLCSPPEAGNTTGGFWTVFRKAGEYLKTQNILYLSFQNLLYVVFPAGGGEHNGRLSDRLPQNGGHIIPDLRCKTAAIYWL